MGDKPSFEIPPELRDMAEKNVEQARVAAIPLRCSSITIAIRQRARVEACHRSPGGNSDRCPSRLTMADGRVRAVKPEGVGCPQGMCSRVKAREEADSIWLDGLASVSGISRTAGPVAATFKFKDGTERQASIIAVNRVLYLQRPFGFTEKIDLASVSKINFE